MLRGYSRQRDVIWLFLSNKWANSWASLAVGWVPFCVTNHNICFLVKFSNLADEYLVTDRVHLVSLNVRMLFRTLIAGYIILIRHH